MSSHHRSAKPVLGSSPIMPITDDGSVCEFCTSCAFSSICRSMGYAKDELKQLHCLVEHTSSFKPGDYIFRTGDTFRALYAVRSGMVKTVMVDANGREQVLGFYLPGEVVGLNAIYPERYPCDAIALEDTGFCRFSFPAMSEFAARVPHVQKHLFQMLSKELGTATLLAGDHTADERLAAFLVDLGERYAVRGLSATDFRLSMSRADMANYLRLAAETVSRVLGRFREHGWLKIEGRRVHIMDIDSMYDCAQYVLNR